MTTAKRLLREPFVHFLALGAVIFLAYGAVSEKPAVERDNAIDVSSERIDGLREQFRAVWRRDPTASELKGLIENYINEEVLYRTALAMGLERDDQVIRQRLRYKLEFLADSGVELVDPGDEALQAYMDHRLDLYRIEPRISFRQIYLGDRPATAEINATRAAAAGNGANVAQLGEPTMLPPEMELADRHEVDRVFGQGFYDAIVGATGGEWTAPVRSGFGFHLVMVTGTRSGRVPALAEVRAAVLRDWRAARTEEMRAAQYASLRSRFDITVGEKPAR